MRRHLQTYQRCWADEQRKESNYKIFYQNRQCPKGQKTQQPNQSKGSVQMQSYSQLKSKDSLNNVHHFMPTAARERI